MTNGAPAAPRGPRLADLVRATTEASHAATGFHHRHVIDATAIPAATVRFRDAGFVLEMITCTDLRFAGDGTEPCLRLSYVFNRHRIDETERHLLVADLPPAIPGAEAPSIVGDFAGADWFEREVYDMFGVRFAGHPDLKRILLPDDATFHALLKDFGRIDEGQESGASAEDEA